MVNLHRRRPHNPAHDGRHSNGRHIFVAPLMERAVLYKAVNSFLHVMLECGKEDYVLLTQPYARTDVARNGFCQTFTGLSTQDDDTLVMLDADHTHPQLIVSRLASHEEPFGVVGALAFTRGTPPTPMFRVRNEQGELMQPISWQKGLIPVAWVATPAIAIKRWVFDRVPYPWFTYKDEPGDNFIVSEDIVFCRACERAGIQVYCDTGIITPHLDITEIGDRTWEDYVRAHPPVKTPESASTAAPSPFFGGRHAR